MFSTTAISERYVEDPPKLGLIERRLRVAKLGASSLSLSPLRCPGHHRDEPGPNALFVFLLLLSAVLACCGVRFGARGVLQTVSNKKLWGWVCCLGAPKDNPVA